MTHIHKKFTAEQVKVLLTSYEEGHITREEVEKTIVIGKTRFFALLKQVRERPETFSIDYQRKNKGRLSSEVEERIKTELLRDKELVDDKEIPISGYNYAALNDRLEKEGIKVSTPTIIKRANQLNCYQAKKKKKAQPTGK